MYIKRKQNMGKEKEAVSGIFRCVLCLEKEKNHQQLA